MTLTSEGATRKAGDGGEGGAERQVGDSSSIGCDEAFMRLKGGGEEQSSDTDSVGGDEAA